MARAKVYIAFCLAFFVCAEASVFLSIPNSPYMSFWLPGGLFVAVLLLNPTNSWPWLALAILPAGLAFDLPRGLPLLVCLGFCASNIIQALVGAWLVRRFIAERPTLANLKEFIGLVGLAGVSSTILGAIIGAGTLVASGMSNSFVESWKIWWGSTAMAVLLFSPFLLVWLPRSPAGPRRPFNIKRRAEAALLGCLLVLVQLQISFSDRGIMSPNKGWLVPIVLWAGLRFGVRGATAVNLLLSIIMATYLTTRFPHGLSPNEIASGEYIHVLDSLMAMVPLVGIVPAIVLNDRDLTLRRLRESEERYRHLTEAAFEGICISENSRIFDINEQGLKMFGYGRDEIIGKAIVDLVAPDSRALVAEAIRSGREGVYEHQLLRKDGTVFDAEAQAKMIQVENHMLRMTALRDITERKRTQAALVELQRHHERILTSVGEGLHGIDREGKIIFENPAAAAMLGWEVQELIGQSAHALMHHTRVDGAPYHQEECNIHATLRDGVVRNVENDVFWRKDGTSFPVAYTCTPMRSETGEIVGVVVAFRDITAHLQAEQRLQKSREQLRALSARLQSLREEERARIAREIHDHLGQLLTALKLDLHFVARRVNTLAGNDQYTALTEKLTSAKGLADEIIRAIQQIASELRPAILDRIGLEAAIEGEAVAFESRASIHCDFSLPAKSLDVTRDQATAAFRIFQETLTNVARHAHASRVNICLSQDNGSLVLTVADDGVGIVEADLERPQSLGLLGMQERAEILGGHIQFKRNPDKGTTVTLRLPLSVKSPPP